LTVLRAVVSTTPSVEHRVVEQVCCVGGDVHAPFEIAQKVISGLI
jgi:hypothetical protein